MNCSEARDSLPGLLYGDLKPAAAAGLENHLAACPACRQEYAALKRLRETLDRVPAPETPIDLPRLYRQAAGLRTRQARHWRRAALAASAVAAALVLALGLQLEIRADGHQLVVRWGAPPPAAEAVAPTPTPPVPPAVVRAEPQPVSATGEEVRLLRDLIHALAAEVESHDGRHREELARVRARLNELHWQSERRWADTQGDVTALYAAQFGPREKGARP